MGRGIKTFAGDVAQGFFNLTHNGLALVGVAVVLAAALLASRPDLRQQGEERLFAWLNARQAATLGMEPEPGAAERATAANPGDLPPEQAAVALWIARKYRVAPEPVAALVAEAYEVGNADHVDPKLVLAVMAVESSFNPFAQSSVGAQGLMQVMTTVHSDKYQSFGGQYAAFDPRTNLRVGVKVLQESIARAGSVEAGLRRYVGAGNLAAGNGYVEKVLAELARLTQVAKEGGALTADDDGASATALHAAPESTAAPLGGAPHQVKVAALS
jgi:soluble lytic murein transglycosylase-like protein